MTFQQAKWWGIGKRVFGELIFWFSLFSTLLSLLIFSSQQISREGKGIGVVLADLFHLIVEVIQFNLPSLNTFWHRLPVPDFSQLMTLPTLKFLFIYFMIFFGMACSESGKRISRQLRHIRERIDDTEVIEALINREKITPDDLLRQITIPGRSIFRHYIILFITPVLLAWGAYQLLRLLGWA